MAETPQDSVQSLPDTQLVDHAREERAAREAVQARVQDAAAALARAVDRRLGMLTPALAPEKTRSTAELSAAEMRQARETRVLRGEVQRAVRAMREGRTSGLAEMAEGAYHDAKNDIAANTRSTERVRATAGETQLPFFSPRQPLEGERQGGLRGRDRPMGQAQEGVRRSQTERFHTCVACSYDKFSEKERNYHLCKDCKSVVGLVPNDLYRKLKQDLGGRGLAERPSRTLSKDPAFSDVQEKLGARWKMQNRVYGQSAGESFTVHPYSDVRLRRTFSAGPDGQPTWRPAADVLAGHARGAESILADVRAGTRVACIGSRGLGAEDLTLCERLGEEIARRGGTVVTGNALGADQAFARGANRIDPSRVEIHLPWKSYEADKIEHGNQVFLSGGNRNRMAEALALHPAADRLSDGAKLLHTRNVGIIDGPAERPQPADLVIAYPRIGPQRGGTGMGMDIAAKRGTPLLDLSKDSVRSRAQGFVDGTISFADRPALDLAPVEGVFPKDVRRAYDLSRGISGKGVQRSEDDMMLGGERNYRTPESIFTESADLDTHRNGAARLSDFQDQRGPESPRAELLSPADREAARREAAAEIAKGKLPPQRQSKATLNRGDADPTFVRGADSGLLTAHAERMLPTADMRQRAQEKLYNRDWDEALADDRRWEQRRDQNFDWKLNQIQKDPTLSDGEKRREKAKVLEVYNGHLSAGPLAEARAKTLTPEPSRAYHTGVDEAHEKGTYNRFLAKHEAAVAEFLESRGIEPKDFNREFPLNPGRELGDLNPEQTVAQRLDQQARTRAEESRNLETSGIALSPEALERAQAQYRTEAAPIQGPMIPEGADTNAFGREPTGEQLQAELRRYLPNVESLNQGAQLAGEETRLVNQLHEQQQSLRGIDRTHAELKAMSEEFRWQLTAAVQNPKAFLESFRQLSHEEKHRVLDALASRPERLEAMLGKEAGGLRDQAHSHGATVAEYGRAYLRRAEGYHQQVQKAAGEVDLPAGASRSEVREAVSAQVQATEKALLGVREKQQSLGAADPVRTHEVWRALPKEIRHEAARSFPAFAEKMKGIDQAKGIGIAASGIRSKKPTLVEHSGHHRPQKERSRGIDF